jgi:hypothetical protein
LWSITECIVRAKCCGRTQCGVGRIQLANQGTKLLGVGAIVVVKKKIENKRRV